MEVSILNTISVELSLQDFQEEEAVVVDAGEGEEVKLLF